MTNPRPFYEAIHASYELYDDLFLSNKEAKLVQEGGCGMIVSTDSLLYITVMFYYGEEVFFFI